jgi:hypothetical protein
MAEHAAVAGACVTILKAWFDESFLIPDPVVPNSQGTRTDVCVALRHRFQELACQVIATQVRLLLFTQASDDGPGEHLWCDFAL